MCGDGGSSAHSLAADRLYTIQGDIAQQQHQTYMQNYLPLEKSTIKDINNLSDPGFVQQTVDRNVQDVAEQFTKVKAERERQQWGLGINPNDGMYSADSRAMKLAQAGATAGSANSTRLGLKTLQLQSKMNMVNSGRGITSQSLGALGSAASGFAGMANAERNAQAQEDAGTGAAVGGIATAIGMIAV